MPIYKQGAVAHVAALLLFVESKNKKHVQEISLKIRNFQWICDAHAFSYCSIICLILRGDSELPSKTMCNSPLFIKLIHPI